jgi:hypothetical protein
MKNLLGDWFRSVERNSAHAGSERQIFVTQHQRAQVANLLLAD